MEMAGRAKLWKCKREINKRVSEKRREAVLCPAETLKSWRNDGCLKVFLRELNRLRLLSFSNLISWAFLKGPFYGGIKHSWWLAHSCSLPHSLTVFFYSLQIWATWLFYSSIRCTATLHLCPRNTRRISSKDNVKEYFIIRLKCLTFDLRCMFFWKCVILWCPKCCPYDQTLLHSIYQ